MFTAKRKLFSSERGAATSWLAGITSAALILAAVALPATATEGDGATVDPAPVVETTTPEAPAVESAPVEDPAPAEAPAVESPPADEAVIGEALEDEAPAADAPDAPVADNPAPDSDEPASAQEPAATSDSGASSSTDGTTPDNNSPPAVDNLAGLDAPTISSDKADYAAGSRVTLTGSGWNRDSSVRIIVNDTYGSSWKRDVSVDVASDGTLTDAFTLPGWFVSDYDVTATGSPSGSAATTTFTDGQASVDLQQCSNGQASSPNDCEDLNGGSQGWVSGNVGDPGAHLLEGYSTPFRAVMSNLPIGVPVTITFGYDIRHSGANAYDYLTSYQRLDPHAYFGHPAEKVFPTDGVSGLSSTTNTYPIPAPSSTGSLVTGQPTSSFNSLPASERVMTLFGGNFANTDAVKYVSQGDLTAEQSQTQIAVTFTPDSNTAILAWGGHIAQCSVWGVDAKGACRSAGGLSGSPYHMALIDWTATSNVGQKDRSMKANSVVQPGNLTLSKALTGGPAGYTGPFKILYNCGPDFNSFVTLNAGESKTIYGIPSGSVCTISEELPTPPAGYDFGTPTFSPSNSVTIGEGTTLTVTTNNKLNRKSYTLIVTKDATATYTETHTWDVTKSVDPASQSGFAGDKLAWNWAVNVSQISKDSNFEVTGKISITNVSPFEVPFTLEDKLSDGTVASVICPSTTLAANATMECTYTANPTARTATKNTVTVTPDFTGINGASAEATLTWTPKVVNGSATLSDPLLEQSQELTGAGPWEVETPGEHTCSTDSSKYNAQGFYSTKLDNTAYVKKGETTLDQASASTTYTCYLPAATKDATATYTETHTWDVTKSVDPASQSAFAGDPVSWTWKVNVSESSADSAFKVTGKITIANPSDKTLTVTSVTDKLSDNTVAVVDCDPDTAGNQTSLTVAAGKTAYCTYTAEPTTKSATKNIATITTANGQVYKAETGVVFVPTVVNGSATVTDTQIGLDKVLTSGEGPWEYTKKVESLCSTDSSKYNAQGFYSTKLDNTAYVKKGETTLDQASASTTYTCYLPAATKDATATYTETHTWDVTKSVDPASQSAFAGDPVSWTWKVNVSESSADSAFKVTGKITIANPSDKTLTVTSVTDKLSDNTVAVVDCDPDTAGNQTSLTVAAGKTAYCTYTAEPTTKSATKNIATITTANGQVYKAETGVVFVPTVVNGSATVTDTQIGLDKVLTSGEGPWEYTKKVESLCSTDSSKYNAQGFYSTKLDNTAYVKKGETTLDQASASTTYTCYLPAATKDATATYTETHTWDVTKSVDPASQSAFAGDPVSWTWKVNVSESSADSAFKVTGKITIANPSDKTLTVTSVTDKLSDNTVAVVDCDPDTAGNQTSLTVAAGKTAYCTYTAEPTTKSATKNIATITTANGQVYKAETGVVFVPTVVNGSATVTDTQIGLDKVLTSGEGPWEYTKKVESLCSTDSSKYNAQGFYSTKLDNTAYVKKGETTLDQASASTTYTCYIDIPKLDKTSDPAEGTAVEAGNTINYTILVKNEGALPLTNQTLEDVLPTGVTLDTASVTPAGDTTVAGKITWKFDLGAYSQKTFTYKVTVTAGFGTATLVNTATWVEKKLTDKTEHPVKAITAAVTSFCVKDAPFYSLHDHAAEREAVLLPGGDREVVPGERPGPADRRPGQPDDGSGQVRCGLRSQLAHQGAVRRHLHPDRRRVQPSAGPVEGCRGRCQRQRDGLAGLDPAVARRVGPGRQRWRPSGHVRSGLGEPDRPDGSALPAGSAPCANPPGVPKLDKTANPAEGTTVAIGQTINYSILVTNTGGSTFTGPMVDTLPRRSP